MENKYRTRIIDKFNTIVKNKKKSKQIENSVYLHIKEQADKHEIVDFFQNNYYKKQYMIKCISLFVNLNKNSYIKNNNLLKNIKKKIIKLIILQI